jgi:hypothetical protein
MMFLPELVCEKNKINVYFISDKGDLLIRKIDRNMRNFTSFKYLLLITNCVIHELFTLLSSFETIEPF